MAELPEPSSPDADDWRVALRVLELHAGVWLTNALQYEGAVEHGLRVGSPEAAADAALAQVEAISLRNCAMFIRRTILPPEGP